MLRPACGMDPKTQVTLLLLDVKNGSSHALDRLVPLVYDELRRLAAALSPRRTRGGDAAADGAGARSLHEAGGAGDARLGIPLAFLRRGCAFDAPDPRGPCPPSPQPETRRRRGPGVPLEDAIVFAPSKSDDILAMDDALTALAAVDERKCRVIELRYFGGLSVDETARALKLSVGTIGREQRLAEAWLHREMSRPA